MNHSKSPLWGSIGILIGAVIAICALARGAWELPLLVLVVGVWALWAILFCLIPLHRLDRLEKKRQKRIGREIKELNDDGVTDERLARLLLRHVSYRVSAALRSCYPDANWEWTMENPVLFVANGGTGRIRIYGVPGFEFADVTLDEYANLSCMLVKVAPVRSESTGEEKKQPALNPRVWYDTRAKSIIHDIVNDLNSRGYNRLYLMENGELYTKPTADGEEIPLKTALPDMPAKVYWPKLVEVLTQDGLGAAVQEDRLQLAW
ncbi:MAG: hypothetical protein J5449_05635 [Oscillospiraceae bacterium]|nr:hypothetical protein [Oscillospiraceae bacterium]